MFPEYFSPDPLFVCLVQAVLNCCFKPMGSLNLSCSRALKQLSPKIISRNLELIAARNFTLNEHPEISASGFLINQGLIIFACVCLFCFVLFCLFLCLFFFGCYVYCLVWSMMVDWLVGSLVSIIFPSWMFTCQVTGITLQQAPCAPVLRCWTAWAGTTQQAEGRWGRWRCLGSIPHPKKQSQMKVYMDSRV